MNGAWEAVGRCGERTAAAVRRTYSLITEMTILVGTVLLWQLWRVPYEVSAEDAIEAARDWIALERFLAIDSEGTFVRWVHARPDLVDTADWFYANMDAPIAFGLFAALRLVDPLCFPTLRTAFVLSHLPAIVVVALYPMAPPRWVPEFPHSSSPPVDFASDMINSTAAAVSLHVGVPVLLAAAAIWMRPRAPLAWALMLYPAFVLAVVVGTGNHFWLDAIVGVACVTLGAAAALVIHGKATRSPSEARPLGIFLAGLAFAVITPALNAIMLRILT